ncbi:hypothetical protein DNK48_20575 [Streptomyces malaysiensis subsp. malaysiensis]|nr:hypothetical protein DNK48_20575 [Streptomyces malaysiensis]
MGRSGGHGAGPVGGRLRGVVAVSGGVVRLFGLPAGWSGVRAVVRCLSGGPVHALGGLVPVPGGSVSGGRVG